jgi:hypothetical protein
MCYLRNGSFYNKHQLLCGLRILNPEGGQFKHDHREGWQIDTPEIEDDLKIYLQDDLTYIGNKVMEIEKYIQHYGSDINRITFYTWHRDIVKIYPGLNFKWYPLFLSDHRDNAILHREEIEKTFNFNDKTKKFLCLNARVRHHRDLVYGQIKNNPNCISSYTHRGIMSPMPDDWTVKEYEDWWIKDVDAVYLPNTKNLLHVSELYNNASFSLVTETRYELPFDFITEKTTQCFLALHPALYVTTKGQVQILREWGFDVFDDVFNHDYDYVDNDMRLGTLLKDNQHILEDGLVIDDQLKSRLIANRNHYFEKFGDVLDTKVA